MSTTSVWPYMLAGCCVGNVIINHIMYADDLVFLAPYVAGISNLRVYAEHSVNIMILSSIRRKVLHCI